MENDQKGAVAEEPGVRRTTLPDGRVLVVRPARTSDIERLIDFYRGLPLEDRYFRFFTGSMPPRSHFERVVDVAGHRGVALLAEVGASGEGAGAEGPAGAAPLLVGDACYIPQASGDGELAVTVDPQWRGWLGPYLLDALLEAAAARGIKTLQAEILVGNRPMLALVRSRGCATIGDDDLSKVRVAVGTASRTPSWPPRDSRRRVLVEGSNPRWRGGLTSVGPTMNVMVCPGPPVGYRTRCPALMGEPCPLAAEADAIVVARFIDDEIGRELLDAHLRTSPGVPVLVETSAKPLETSAKSADEVSLPAGVRVLPRALPDAEAAAMILDAIGDRSPTEPKVD